MPAPSVFFNFQMLKMKRNWICLLCPFWGNKFFLHFLHFDFWANVRKRKIFASFQNKFRLYGSCVFWKMKILLNLSTFFNWTHWTSTGNHSTLLQVHRPHYNSIATCLVGETCSKSKQTNTLLLLTKYSTSKTTAMSQAECCVSTI